MNVLVEGTTPFRLLRRIDDLPYPAGDVEPLVDDEQEEGDAAAIEAARKRYADLVAEVTDERPEADVLAELDAYGMAATLDVALDAKQMLLELRSERGPAGAARGPVRGGARPHPPRRARRRAGTGQRQPQGLDV